MKRIIWVFPVLLICVLAACQGQKATEPPPTPTAMTFPTAEPTTTPIPLNPTATMDEKQEPQVGDERVSPVDGMTMVYIPEGTFRMGGLDAEAQDDEFPARQVSIKGYWIDKVEVTVGMYTLCTKAGVCEPPRMFTSNTRDRYFDNIEFNDYPVINVSWGDAVKYCSWAGRRLPTEAEWERAARGDDYRTYPWGLDDPDASHANYGWIVGDTVKVGSFPLGASPFGVLDLAGNVWEWIMDYYNPGFYSIAGKQDPMGPMGANNGERRGVRGGSWQDEWIELRVSNRGFSLGSDLNAAPDSNAYRGEANNKIGFRCVADQ